MVTLTTTTKPKKHAPTLADAKGRFLLGAEKPLADPANFRALEDAACDLFDAIPKNARHGEHKLRDLFWLAWNEYHETGSSRKLADICDGVRTLI